MPHLHGLAAYVKMGALFALENALYSYLCFQQALLFPLSITFFVFVHSF